ncbi:MAG: DNA polymerase III subunit delta [Burkholderiaceae bacterium]|nr:DNA polymerase III subunit delta [Burkholderiaceae bacterium]
MQIKLDLRTPDGIKKIIDSASKSRTPQIWAISGDDPLLTGEAADSLRAHLKSKGVMERQVEVPDRSFDWKGWLSAAGTGSLFSDQRLMDLRLPTGKPGTEGSKSIQAWCANPPADVVLLVSLPRADKAMFGASWFNALDQSGIVVIVPELYRSDLPNWISQRLRAVGLSATPDAIGWLCDQCEGNLIAAHQEILKLALHHEQKENALDIDDVKHLIADVARFSPFSLGEAVLAGDASRAVRILRGLKAEAEPLPLVLWSITEDLRMLARAQQLVANGRSSDMALREARIPRHRERLIATSLRQTPAAKTWRALRQAAEVDTMIKGLKHDDPWVALEKMAIEFA